MMDKIFDKLPYDSMANVKFIHMVVVALVIAGIVLGCYNFLLYDSMKQEYAALEQKKVDMENKLVRYQSEVAQKEALTKQVATLAGTLVERKRQLPLPEEIPTLLNKMADVAEFLGLRILEFKMGDAADNEFYKEIPMTISLMGDFYRTAGFFDTMQSLLRLVNVSDLKMEMSPFKQVSKGEDGERIVDDVDKLKTSIEAKTYAYIESPGASKGGGK